MNSALVSVAAFVLLAIGLLHVIWAARGSVGASTVIPTGDDGRPTFVPGRWPTLAIGLGLSALAVVTANHVARWTTIPFERGICGAFAAIFVVRAIGDFNYVGFFKRRRASAFAYWDTRLFSPTSLFLGIALAVAAV